MFGPREVDGDGDRFKIFRNDIKGLDFWVDCLEDNSVFSMNLKALPAPEKKWRAYGHTENHVIGSPITFMVPFISFKK